MSKSALKKTLLSVVGAIFLVTFLHVMPISISLGQDKKTKDRDVGFDLLPGQGYMVYSDRPINLPEGAWVGQSFGLGSGLSHDDFRKDKPKHCGGHIKMVMKNSGCVEYECVLCKQKWRRDKDGRITKLPDKD